VNRFKARWSFRKWLLRDVTGNLEYIWEKITWYEKGVLKMNSALEALTTEAVPPPAG
jgi:hypothetical protein